MHTGLISGSFDSVTKGHIWLFEEALKALGEHSELFIIVSNNPNKKYFLSEEDRVSLVQNAIFELSRKYRKIMINVIVESQRFTADLARENEVDIIFRGIRNISDFEYEQIIQKVDRKIQDIQHAYFIAPPEISHISSSLFKGLIRSNGWEKIASDYVDQSVIDKIKTMSEELKRTGF
jgi:pantetheine-phosphate adenylyltransferase